MLCTHVLFYWMLWGSKIFLVSEAWSPIQNHHTSLYCLFARTVTQFSSQSFSPIRKLPSASYPSPSEGRQTENHNLRKLTNQITWAAASSNSMNLWAMPCRVTHTDRSWWRVLTKCGSLEKEMEDHFSILASRTPWTVWKDKKIGHWKMNSSGQLCPICYWRSVEK